MKEPKNIPTFKVIVDDKTGVNSINIVDVKKYHGNKFVVVEKKNSK